MKKRRSKKKFQLTRRHFITTGIGLLSAFYSARFGFRKHNSEIAGGIVGAAAHSGHLLRGSKFPTPVRTVKTDCMIVGGGISGLSAAWRLQKKGFQNFFLLDLEKEVGGNSQSGENPISRYPWGAHYIPLPGKDAVWVRELFEELGVIEGYNSKGLPIYNEYYLCADPQERLFIQGQWQEGIVPHAGISEKDRSQYDRFNQTVEEFKRARGSDGKPAFTIPLEMSSRDPQFTHLDQISMAEYLRLNDWDSPVLHWYINYCCRDDFGSTLDQVSAWAGIHYFASRKGEAANAPAHSVVTWPEGNGWIVHRLKEKISTKIRTENLVFQIKQIDENQVWVDSLDLKTQEVTRWIAKNVIFASPRFVGARVIQSLMEHPPQYLKSFTYAPWMVANITLKSAIFDSWTSEAWDNILYQGRGLGYVVATHQTVARYPSQSTVWTYFYPLTEESPKEARQLALVRTHSEWCQLILGDLSKMHPGIEDLISNIDVWLWGHGMIRPVPGLIWGKDRAKSHQDLGKIIFAHSDMSGLSLFEEAQYWGIRAAEKVLQLQRMSEV